MANQALSGLVWMGAYHTPTGYGDEARGFIGALAQSRQNLRIVPFGGWGGVLSPQQEQQYAALEQVPVDIARSVVVHHYPPYQFFEHVWGQVNISRTMFESDRIPAPWIEQSRRLHEIWVPCRFNLETFGNHGIPLQKLRLVPGGVDVNVFHPAAPPLPLEERYGFTFLSLFIWTDHKGWDLLLTAYCTEFKPHEDVMLLIKTFKIQHTPGTIDEQYHAFLQQHGLHPEAIPKVRIIDGYVPSSLMPGLYTACDAFVMPSRNEAWGRPYIEAMACGLPVIGTGWGGNLEFMNGENSYLIEIEGLEDVPVNAENYIYQGHRWSRPSVEHLRQLMRHVFEHRQEARERGGRGRADVCQRWTWEQAAAIAARELVKYGC